VELQRKRFAGGAANWRLLTRSGDGEVEKSLVKHQCRGSKGSAARILSAAKFGEVRRSSSEDSPGGEVRATNGAAEAQRAKNSVREEVGNAKKEEEGAVFSTI
jgi:hypothetical protein